MADISQYTLSILNDIYGESVRDSIMNAMTLLHNSINSNANSISDKNGKRIFYNELLNEDQRIRYLVPDNMPIENSINPVISAWLYEVLGSFYSYEDGIAMDENQPENARITIIHSIYESMAAIAEVIYEKGQPCAFGVTNVLLYGNLIRNIFVRTPATLTVTKNGEYYNTSSEYWTSVYADVVPYETIDLVATEDYKTYEAPEGFAYNHVEVNVKPAEMACSYDKNTGIFYTDFWCEDKDIEPTEEPEVPEPEES